MKVKRESEVTQSCPTLRDPMDFSLPGSSVRGIFQARVLEWVAIAFSLKMTTLSLSFVSAPAPSCKALASFVPSLEQRPLFSSWRAPLCPSLWGFTALAFYRQKPLPSLKPLCTLNSWLWVERWAPNVTSIWNLEMWPYLEKKGSLQMKFRISRWDHPGLDWALNSMTTVLIKRSRGIWYRHRGNDLWDGDRSCPWAKRGQEWPVATRNRERDPEQKFRKERTLMTPWVHSSSFQNCEWRHVNCFQPLHLWSFLMAALATGTALSEEHWKHCHRPVPILWSVNRIWWPLFLHSQLSVRDI